MKTHCTRIGFAFAIATLLALPTQEPALAESIAEFSDSVNSEWEQTNDTAVAELISRRLAVNSNDVLAVSAQMYFRLFAEGNVQGAHDSGDLLLTIVTLSTNERLRAIVQEMHDEIHQVPLTESGAPTEGQLRQLHGPPGYGFPFMIKCVMIARWFELEHK